MRLDQQWNLARDAWLRTAERGSPHTTRAYARAIADFAKFISPQGLWEAGGADASRWANEMGEQLAATSVNARLAAVSAFYTFCMTAYTDGQGTPLASFNPIAQVRREKISPYARSRPLSSEQVRSLLTAIDMTTMCGNRDYAMILMALFTGRRSAEIRCLRWCDIMHTAEGQVRYHWKGKGGKARWDDMPPPVYAAIQAYAMVGGQRRPGDYVFASHNGQQTTNPLTSQFFNVMVQRYAKLAKLPAWVHVHTLRHTATALRLKSGCTILELQALLGHASPRTTMIYVEELRGFKDESWHRVADLLAGAVSSQGSSSVTPQVPKKGALGGVGGSLPSALGLGK